MELSNTEQQQERERHRMFPSEPIIETNITQHETIGSTNFFSEHHRSSKTEEEWIGNAHTILRQPISNLRCNRRRSTNRHSLSSQQSDNSDNNRQSNCNQQQQHRSDLLDYIDKIPIKDLEMGLLNKHHRHDNETSKSTNYRYSQPGLDNLDKPIVVSPSPPKMYRMSMF